MANSTTANAIKRKVIIGDYFRVQILDCGEAIKLYTPEALTCLIYSALRVCGKRCEILQ